MDTQQRRKREWWLLFLILPFGITVMFITGQFAIRQPSTWRVQAEMNSALDPLVALENNSYEHVEPIRAEIMTIPAWMGTFLTPPATNTHLPGLLSNSSDSSSDPSKSPTASPITTITLTNSPSPSPTVTTTLTPSGTPTTTITPTLTPTYVWPTSTKASDDGGGGGDGCVCVEYASANNPKSSCKVWNPPGCGD